MGLGTPHLLWTPYGTLFYFRDQVTCARVSARDLEPALMYRPRTTVSASVS